MTSRRYFCRTLVALGCAVNAPLAKGQTDHGKESVFDKLATPQPTEDKGRIEVIEFFWYGCPHCHELEPAVEAWEKSLPKDVAFRHGSRSTPKTWRARCSSSRLGRTSVSRFKSSSSSSSTLDRREDI